MESDETVPGNGSRRAVPRGVPAAQVALAWVCQRPGVVAPIVGASKMGQIDAAVAALALNLSADEMKALEEPYVPHPVAI